jgi:thiol-disulfide isomerase/thioredoxin
MSTRAARVAGAALLTVFGIWAGTKVYSTRGALQSPREVPLAAGVASAPTPGDMTRTDAAPEGAAAAPDGGLLPGALPASKIPDRLPHFSLEDRAGQAISIGSFGGKSLIINFWATWCAPCRSEIPLLETLHAEWAGRDVTVVGIAVDTRDKVLEFANRFKIVYPLLIGEQDALDAAAAFGVESPVFPFTVFTDRRGEVVALFIGELHRPQAELILSEVQNLNMDRVQLPAARRAIAEGLRALDSRRPG